MSISSSRAWLAIAALGAAVGPVLGACDGGNVDGQVREAYREFQKAVQARDYRAMCALTTEDGRRHLDQLGHDGGQGCLREMRKLMTAVLERESDPRQTRIVDVDVASDGERAAASVVFGDGARANIPLAVEAGEWKVDALYGGIPAAEQRDKFKRLR